ncbi:hypothetical protein QTP70_006564 [Hemibagrus guttatus]|uniref:Thrombomodulin n=1 Tax=Hemibagrus guttatus TaxID=175788 RepID=A0AAE0UHS3_9TELE|nr:hypothetical protein QTP70_006564 [Hemibagrus guttatus]KAK3522344.1 hypothetical protein QTP86_006497 [Hemibagrus guttatus]
MKPFLGVVMALALLRVHARKPDHGNCVDEYCVTVHTEPVDFNSAQKSCEDKGGHLMTVRTMVASSVVSDVLTGYTGNFWIGLRHRNDFCSGSTHALKGYTWITGDKATNFTNWKSHEGICSQRCVSLSKDDPEWTERLCDHAADGYLCEHKNTDGKCRRLESDSPVLYETPFGFARTDLREVPAASNATQQHLGTKFICFEGQWIKAPWNCEVYKGGCEHECIKWNDAFMCSCPPGYTLERNAVRCSLAHGDPCLRAGCSQECVVKGESYVCRCRSGYELGEDGKTCKDIENCENINLCPDENSYCVDTPGGFECHCKSGFSMNRDKNRCEDDDECFSGPCEHTCNNTIGSYFCECSEGYRVSPEDRHMCTLHCPHWECPVVSCDLNNPFQCECPEGFVLEERPGGSVCVDIDECETSICDHNCTNTPGRYICSCTEGFDLTGSNDCVRTKRFGTTTSASAVTTPTSRSPPTEPVPFISAGGIIAIIACIVLLVLLVPCVHHHKNRCGKISTDKSHGKDVHALQQVTTEKYVKKSSITNI